MQKPTNALGWQLEYTMVAMMSSACKWEQNFAQFANSLVEEESF
jgi:hypothetical protein